jgi:hypothetical protein
MSILSTRQMYETSFHTIGNLPRIIFNQSKIFLNSQFSFVQDGLPKNISSYCPFLNIRNKYLLTIINIILEQE